MKNFKRIFAFVSVLILCLSLTACGSKKLNLSDYLSVKFYGENGNGTAHLSFDAAQMELDFAGVKDGYPTQKQFDKMLSLAPFEFSLNWELNKSENLKNGDKVKATITYSKGRAKEAKVKVGSVKKTFTVKGLD